MKYSTAMCTDDEDVGGSNFDARSASGTVRIVMVTGFESFNVDLYKKASGGIGCGAKAVVAQGNVDVGATSLMRHHIARHAGSKAGGQAMSWCQGASLQRSRHPVPQGRHHGGPGWR